MIRKLASIVAALATAAVAAAPAAAKDYAIIARDIVPSGEYGSVPPPPQAPQQAEMYNALTPLFNHVTSQDLLADFKPDYLGGAAVGPFTTDSVPASGRHDQARRLRRPAHLSARPATTSPGARAGSRRRIGGLLLEEARGDATVAAIDAPGLSALGLIANLERSSPVRRPSA